MMQSTQSYVAKKYPECAPYYGVKGQTWETFINSFAAAMSTHVLAEDSLENTFYGLDIGGERWIDERHPGAYDATGIWQNGNLVRRNGANQAQAKGHTRRAKLLFGYLYKHIADLKLQEFIYVQAYGNGRVAYLVLNEICSQNNTDLELTALMNHAVSNSSIKADVGVTSNPITLFKRYLNSINARRPESMRENKKNLKQSTEPNIYYVSITCPRITLSYASLYTWTTF